MQFCFAVSCLLNLTHFFFIKALPYFPYLLRAGRPVSARGCGSRLLALNLCLTWRVYAALEVRCCLCQSSVQPPWKPHCEAVTLLVRSPSLPCTPVSTRRQQRAAERRPNSSRFLLFGWLQVLYLCKENTMSTVSHCINQQNNTKAQEWYSPYSSARRLSFNPAISASKIARPFKPLVLKPALE